MQKEEQIYKYPEYVYYAHEECVHFFKSNVYFSPGKETVPSLLAASPTPLEILPSRAKWGALSAAPGLSFTDVPLGGSCTSRRDSTAFLLVPNTTAPSLGRSAVVRGPLRDSKTPPSSS